MSRPRISPSLAKRFRSGRVCLDFAHTGDTRDWVEPELIYDLPTLERWLGHVLGLAEVSAQADDVTHAHRLRAAIWQLARDRSENRPLDEGAVQALNDFAAAAPPVPQITGAGELAPLVATATAGLAGIARDAIDLLTGPQGHRIRVCAAEGCEFLFVDASRPGTRRWCSMERCGNLAKVRAHRDSKAGRRAT